MSNWFVPRWQTGVDFAALAAVLYVVLMWARQASALRVALGVAGLHAAALTARYFDLPVTSWILDGAAVVAVVLLLVVFQAELRHAVIKLDTLVQAWLRPISAVQARFVAVPDAAFSLARERLGALMVIVRTQSIDELAESGFRINADVSAPLLISIFQKVSPLHDGAVIVDHGRMTRAGVVLPLTDRNDIPPEYGTRHRAAMGLAERSDALVIAVSEERGEVTLMDGRTPHLIGSALELRQALRRLSGRPPATWREKLRGAFLTNLPIKFAAAGLAGLFWVMSMLPGSGTVRSVSFDLEFRNVPAGLQVVRRSAERIDVQLRGSTWVMDSFRVVRPTARFDLGGAREGWKTLQVGPRVFELPPGISIDQATPERVSVLLAARAGKSTP